MTFKEKLKQEYPERVDEKFQGGCDGCPHEYGYETRWKCDGVSCFNCWNREMPDTPATMTAEETWEIVRRLSLNVCDCKEALTNDDVKAIFDMPVYSVFEKLTPHEAKAKLEEWESKQISVGDVVTEGSSHEYIVIATSKEMPNGQPLLRSLYDHNLVVFGSDRVIKKTGKHIDIQSMLEQIGKEE